MGVIIRKGAQAVELLLASGVPEGELNVDVIDKYVVDIVFEDGGLVYCRKVSAMAPGASEKLRFIGQTETYPLVKTLSSEVLPQAPSPLFEMVVSQLAVMKGCESIQ